MTNLAVVPMPARKVRPIHTKRGRMIILTPQEMLDLLKAARKRSTRDWTMILLAYRHGLRASEVCGIKLADVDLKSGSISIRRLKGSLHTIQPLLSRSVCPTSDRQVSWLTGQSTWAQPIKRKHSTWDLEGGAENSFDVSLRRSTYFEIALFCNRFSRDKSVISA